MLLKGLFQRFIRLQSASSILLFISMCIALILANSPARSLYAEIWNLQFFHFTLSHWINDGLMTIFFFVVGLEIRREFTVGELSTRKKATLPVAAALGGMLMPALIYAAFNWGTPELSGWGIPMATDIAFTLGAVSLLGRRISKPLKVFLTALAIVDDLGAVLVIAIFYSHGLSWAALLLGLFLLAVLRFCNRFQKLETVFYLITGILIWSCFWKSGVHATVSGVLLAMVVPFKSVQSLEQRFHPWVAFGVLPLFAVSNSGVSLSQSNLSNRISLGILIGLILGKQIGITFFSWVAVKMNLAALPEKSSWASLYGISCLAGMGFTMSIFISQLALGPGQVAQAKVAILLASLISFGVGYIYLSRGKSLGT